MVTRECVSTLKPRLFSPAAKRSAISQLGSPETILVDEREAREIGLREKDWREPDIRGAMFFGDRRVVMDESVNPDEDIFKEGRYRFTLQTKVGRPWSAPSRSINTKSRAVGP